MPLSLLEEVFQRYLSAKHTDQLVTHGKTARVAKSVLYKIISPKDLISNEQFRMSTIYRQILIFVDKFFPGAFFLELNKNVILSGNVTIKFISVTKKLYHNYRKLSHVKS